MDQNNNAHPDFPFQVMPSETIFHIFSPISARLIDSSDSQVEFSPLTGNILLTNERLCWYNYPKENNEFSFEQIKTLQSQVQQDGIKTILNQYGKSFMFTYDNLVSHGQTDDKYVCFLGSQEEEEMEIEDEQTTLKELSEQQNANEIVALGKGEYQIYFDFSQLLDEQRKQLIELLTEFSSANQEEDEDDDEQQFLGEMITADNIDQNGNIIINQKNNEDNDSDYEDVDEEEDSDNDDHKE